MATAPIKKQTKVAPIAKKLSPNNQPGIPRAIFMSINKRRRVVGIVFLAFLAVIVAFQLAYPADRGLPVASVAGQSVRLATHAAMAKVITEKFSSTRVKLAVGKDKSVEFDLKQAGAEPNTEQMIEQLSGYPLWLRLIPGSLLWKPAQVTLADVYYADKPFQEFLAAKTKELNFPPENARLSIKQGKVVADEAKEGSKIASSRVRTAVSTAEIHLGVTTTISLPAERTKAARYSKDLAIVQHNADAALGHSITIKTDQKNFSPSKAEVASWIVLDDKGSKVTLRIDTERVKAYLGEINKEVGVPAGQTNITIVDGRETGRVTGTPGLKLAVDIMANQIAQALLVPPQTVTIQAQFQQLSPSVIFNSKYTTTQAGLQAYVNDLANTKNVRIFIQQLDGEKWHAAARETESTPSGSTYKLYVALVLFDKMDKGEIHWDDPMLDTTVAGCFERMTVASTNPCAEAWIAQFGRQYINDFIYARGFSHGTTFISQDATRTTAADLSKYMTGLNDGSLVKSPYRERLLDSLGRHPYRYGIPTGSQGAVHDKVGFLWDYVHDAAIVNHPRGNYIMTIMTKGYSYATIASITREVERIMYP